ncbi:MAG: tetratricopeptide repeat protein [Deltaproteobacteria bacterium]|nr:tetratricopeptide repeat protein [Deltaproteobacteria bacterium]
MLETGLRLSGQIIIFLQEARNRTRLKNKNNIRIVCLGESTTAGGENAYPAQLENVLNESGLGVEFSVINRGLRATNTTIILSQLKDDLRRYNPDIVVAMIGINDAGSHMPQEPETNSRAVLFLRSFKVYKLFSLLKLHIAAKFTKPDFRQTDQAYSEVYDKLEKLDDHYEAAHAALGDYYRINKNYLAAEMVYKAVLERDKEDVQARIGLARLYWRNMSRDQEAEKLYNEVIELDPHNEYAYGELSDIYRYQLRYADMEALLVKRLKQNPDDYRACRGLAWFYNEMGDFARSRELYEKVITMEPLDSDNYFDLGKLYLDHKKYAQAQELFETAVELRPTNKWALLALAEVLRKLGQYDYAMLCFEKVLELEPDNDMASGGVALACAEKYGGASKLCRSKVQKIKPSYYTMGTIENYQKIKTILNQRNIPLVSVQYPMRDIRPLRQIFTDSVGIVFVDNSSLFKQAVYSASYEDYFIDSFGGDFGHCTPKGNRLLAENVASAIIESFFSR